MDPATARRDCAALALVATAVLSAVSNATAPEFPSGYADRLAEIDAAGARAWVSSSAFVLAQLPFLVAVLGLGMGEEAAVLHRRVLLSEGGIRESPGGLRHIESCSEPH